MLVIKERKVQIMRYDWNKPLIPGTIVCSNYNTFEGEQKVGLFLVLYDEQNDNLNQKIIH